MKKKICFVAEYMLCGGTEKSLLSLLPLLDRNKYDITLLLMKKKGDLLTELPEDIKVHEIPLPKELEGFWNCRDGFCSGYGKSERQTLSWLYDVWSDDTMRTQGSEAYGDGRI